MKHSLETSEKLHCVNATYRRESSIWQRTTEMKHDRLKPRDWELGANVITTSLYLPTCLTEPAKVLDARCSIWSAWVALTGGRLERVDVQGGRMNANVVTSLCDLWIEWAWIMMYRELVGPCNNEYLVWYLVGLEGPTVRAAKIGGNSSTYFAFKN